MYTKKTLSHIARLAAPIAAAIACAMPGAAAAAAASPMDGGSGARLRLDRALAIRGLSPEECDDGDLVLQTAGGKPVATRPVKLSQVASTTVDAPAPAKKASVSDESVKPAQAWEIVTADKTLNASLARWAASAGWQLVWELPVDYSIETHTTITGTFQQAIGTVIKSMGTAEVPPKAIFYAGNKVLRIVAKGVE